eukprot:INCI4976.14.p1 GENE.INCI4976.14~~INCI4976.14.p1  ORF type:complete len:763 (-),score=186.94 INCI4976.14:2266-4554(-)
MVAAAAMAQLSAIIQEAESVEPQNDASGTVDKDDFLCTPDFDFDTESSAIAAELQRARKETADLADAAVEQLSFFIEAAEEQAAVANLEMLRCGGEQAAAEERAHQATNVNQALLQRAKHAEDAAAKLRVEQQRLLEAAEAAQLDQNRRRESRLARAAELTIHVVVAPGTTCEDSAAVQTGEAFAENDERSTSGDVNAASTTAAGCEAPTSQLKPQTPQPKQPLRSQPQTSRLSKFAPTATVAMRQLVPPQGTSGPFARWVRHVLARKVMGRALTPLDPMFFASEIRVSVIWSPKPTFLSQTQLTKKATSSARNIDGPRCSLVEAENAENVEPGHCAWRDKNVVDVAVGGFVTSFRDLTSLTKGSVIELKPVFRPAAIGAVARVLLEHGIVPAALSVASQSPIAGILRRTAGEKGDEFEHDDERTSVQDIRMFSPEDAVLTNAVEMALSVATAEPWVRLNSLGLGSTGAVFALALALQSIASDSGTHTPLTLRELYLPNNNIDDNGAIALANALRSPGAGSLVKLDLTNNNIGSRGVGALAAALRDSVNEPASVDTLASATCKDIDDIDRGICVLAAAGRSSRLQELTLTGNRAGDAGARELAVTLLTNQHLQALDLRNNSIGDLGAAALALALEANERLQWLSLSNNAVRDMGAAAIAQALAANPKSGVRWLSLQRNGIGDSGAAALAGVLRNNSVELHKIDLHDNDIGLEGATDLAEALQTNSTLQVLVLKDNQIELAAQAALKAAKDTNPALHNLYLFL